MAFRPLMLVRSTSLLRCPRALLLMVPLTAGCAGSSQAAEQPPPQLALAPATRLTLQHRLDAYVAPLESLGVFSGVVRVSRDTVPILDRAYGLAHREFGIPMATTHRFRIASVSKPFTRLLFGRLVERGVLQLEHPVARWLPATTGGDRMTIRMLLDHRAGVPNVNSVPYDEESAVPVTLSTLVDSLSGLPLDFAPGTARRYSNGGYALLARIAELATGREFGALLADEVLRPLGLHHTVHEADGDLVPELATGYMPSPSHRDRTVRAPWQSMATKAGGGSMVSNATDLTRFATAIGHDAILAPETWRLLFPHDTLQAWTGRAPGYNTAVVVDRRRGLTAVVLSNNYATGLAYELALGALAIARGEEPTALPVATPTTVDPADLACLEGRYRAPADELPIPGESILEVKRHNGDLVLAIGDQPLDVLIPQGSDRFLARGLWSMLAFTRAPCVAGEVEIRPLYRDHRFAAHRIP